MKRFLYLAMGVLGASFFLVAQASAADIKIGISGPITGPYAKFGEQLVQGATAAADEINASGGINGDKIVIVRGDDACEPKQARAVANRHANDRVHAVIGHFCSSSTIPASEVYDENNILMVTPASTNPRVTDRGLPSVFRVCGRDDQQGSVAAQYIATVKRAKRVAVIHDKDTYGQGLADAMRTVLNSKYGIKEVLYEGVTRGDKDFNSLVTKMKGLNVDLIYFGGLHSEGGLIARQAHEQGLDVPFISGDGVVTDEFSRIAGAATKNVLMTFGKDPQTIPQARQAVERFKKAGYSPEGYTLYSYAAMQVVADAIRKNKNSRDGAKMGGYLKGSGGVNTVMGLKQFDQKGDLKVSDYVMYRWYKKDGKWAYREVWAPAS